MTDWLDYDRFAVFGLGRSGIAAANLLAGRSKRVVASDTKPAEELERVAAKLDDSVDLVAGKNAIGDADVVVVSPGLKPRLDIFEKLDERGIPVISEIELADAAAEAPILAITGTDGKSTTTVLAGHILEKAGVECAVGGNLGTPLCDLVDEVSKDGYIVAEVSAFQLWTIHKFKPHAFGFTNIAADHLDYFDTFDEYVAAKRAVMTNADEQTWGVFNLDDARIARFEEDFEGHTVAYSTAPEEVADFDNALWVDEGALSARFEGQEHRRWQPDISTLPFSGEHNLLNLMCATALAHTAGVDLEQVHRAMSSFEPLPHRMEHVATIDGVRFYDDSKATNVHAALAGLESLEGPLVPIIGGVDKGLDLTDLAAFVRERNAPVVLIGEVRDRLEAALLSAGHSDALIHSSEKLQDAVKKAFELAEPGGAVSLSPACSSFDMFDSYAHRGEVYQEVVHGLKAKASV